jgi:hypothetical protein
MAPRSDVIRADLERVGSMTDEEFTDRWGEWARQADRDPQLVRQRWLSDLERALSYALLEETAVGELVAAKEAYREDPTPENRARRDAAVTAVQAIRAEERSQPGRSMVAGDAYVVGTNPVLDEQTGA